MIKGAPDGSERSTVTELSRRLQLAQSTVTELVTRSEAAGLVERRPSIEGLRRLTAPIQLATASVVVVLGIVLTGQALSQVL